MQEDLKKTLLEPHLVSGQNAHEQSISQQAHTGDAVETSTNDLAKTDANKIVTSLVYTLPSQYEILDQLGRGGMGTVFRARHKDLGKMVAIKVINPELLQKEGSATTAGKRFLAEAKAASRLQHENLVVLYEYGMTQEGAAYMIMEYAEGDSLEKYLSKSETLAPEEALNIVMQVCQGLSFAHHTGIVHRDIKPANIILTKKQGKVVPKILDFGIARIEEGGHTQGITATGEVFGSPLYIAPEQSMTSKVDARADVYSLGCMFFEMLSGRPPYLGENAIQTIMMHHKETVPHLSDLLPPLRGGLADVIYKCMDKDPALRYQSVDELLIDLQKVSAAQHNTGEELLPEPHLRRSPPATKERAEEKVRKNKSGSPKKVGSSGNLLVPVLLGAMLIFLALGLGVAKFVSDNFALPPDRPPVTRPNAGQGQNGDLVDKAFALDTGEAFSDFNAGLYQESIIKLRGAVGVYDDAIESLDKKLKTAKGEEYTKLWNKRHRIAYLRVENYQHIADCYVRLKQYEEAADAYAKGFTYVQELYRRRAASPQIVYHYQSYITILKLAGRNELADQLSKELELLKKMPGST